MAQANDLTPPPQDGPLARKRGSWEERVAVSEMGSYTFRPNQIVCRTDADLEIARRVLGEITKGEFAPHPLLGSATLLEFDELDVERALRALREAGAECEPNYVLFTHAANGDPSPLDCWCGCCDPCSEPGVSGTDGSTQANPFFANGLSANPFFANPFFANPFFANPFFANPFFANPFFANPFFANPFFANADATGVRPSSVLPADAPSVPVATKLPAGVARIIVLDTGVAEVDLLPKLLGDAGISAHFPDDEDPPDDDGNRFLDPASGHGTFIAGIVEQLAPGQDVHVFSVLSTLGDGDVASIAARIDLLISDGLVDANTIVNMSFGSYADDDIYLLADAVSALQDKGAVVVASAGNDGTCRPSYPACLDDVVSVGAVDRVGRAFYSNHGPWVRACAPGTGVISSFYAGFDGAIEALPGGQDPDAFDAWCQWTGTLFAAPVVTAALARHMAVTNSDASTATAHVVDHPALFRYPGLGTVVNLVPGM